MKTFSATPADIKKKWILIDAEGVVLGRLASIIANRLRGKHKAAFTPHMDCGDNVVVINADKVALTGKKWDDKMYYRHTGYVGGLKSATATEVRNRHPEDLIRLAVKGMLPRGPLGRAQLRNLKIYAGAEHPHSAQTPEPMTLGA